MEKKCHFGEKIFQVMNSVIMRLPHSYFNWQCSLRKHFSSWDTFPSSELWRGISVCWCGRAWCFTLCIQTSSAYRLWRPAEIEVISPCFICISDPNTSGHSKTNDDATTPLNCGSTGRRQSHCLYCGLPFIPFRSLLPCVQDFNWAPHLLRSDLPIHFCN